MEEGGAGDAIVAGLRSGNSRDAENGECVVRRRLLAIGRWARNPVVYRGIVFGHGALGSIRQLQANLRS